MSRTKRKYFNGKFTKAEIEVIYNYLNDIYGQKEDCYLKIFNKYTNHYKFHNIKTIKDEISLKYILNSLGKNDLLISSNTFKTMQRATESNLFSINTICVDIDYKRNERLKDLSPEQVIKLIEMDEIGKSIPIPNYIEYGNQIRFIYVLKEPVYIPKGQQSALILCNRISEHIAKTLKYYGAEIQKAEKFIRIPYSINTKTLDVVKIIKYDTYKYTLGEIRELWLNELPKWYDKWKDLKKIKVKKRNKFNRLEFYNKRLSDLCKIQEYLNNKNEIDYRKRLCFLYHNYSLLVYKNSNEIEKTDDIYKMAINDTLEFNDNFKYPLISSKLISNTKFLRHREYKYSNNKLMELLDLNHDLCCQLNLLSIYEIKPKRIINKDYYRKNKDKYKVYYNNNKDKLKTYKNNYYEQNRINILEKEKERYNRNRLLDNKLSKSEEMEIRKQKIKSLLLQGLKNKEISNRLDISISTTKRYISILKKEELLQ